MKISSSILSVLASGVPLHNFENKGRDHTNSHFFNLLTNFKMIFDIILSKAIDSNFHFRRNQLELTHLVSAAKQIEGSYIIDSNRSANIRFGSDSSIFTILGRFQQ